MAKTATKPAAAPAPEAPKPKAKATPAKEEAPKKTTLGTKEVADLLHTQPTALRRFLRASGANAGDDKNNRYEWEPGSKALKQLMIDWEKHLQEAKAAKTEQGKKLAKAGKKAAKKAAEPEDTKDYEEGGEEEEEIK